MALEFKTAPMVLALALLILQERVVAVGSGGGGVVERECRRKRVLNRQSMLSLALPMNERRPLVIVGWDECYRCCHSND